MMQVSKMQTSPSVRTAQTRSIISKGYLQMITPDLTPRPYNKQLEIWRDVRGYEGIYQISNLGQIKSLKRLFVKIDRVLRLHLLRGYPNVVLAKGGVSKRHTVHRLVALAFLGQPPTPLHEVNHKNGIKTDNRLENLEWVTKSENQKHAFVSGLHSHRGEKNPRAKLNIKQVEEIRGLVSKGMRKKDIAELYNVCSDSINNISAGRTWAS